MSADTRNVIQPTGAPRNLFETLFPIFSNIPAVKGTWGPTEGILGYLNPFSLDYGYTERRRQEAGKTPSAERTTLFNNPEVIRATIGSTGPTPTPQASLPSAQGKISELQNRSSSSSPMSSSNPMSSSKEFTADELKALGISPDVWSGQIIEYGGQKYKVSDTGRGTRTLTPVSNAGGGGSPPSPDEIKRAVQATGSSDVASKLEEIAKDVYEKGMSLADAIEKRGREAAEQRFRATQEVLSRQKGEVSELAKSQREQLGKEEEFYRGELEKRREKDVQKIEQMKQGTYADFLKSRDDLGINFREGLRKFEARARAVGATPSSFLDSEQRKAIEDFNKNLTQLTIQNNKAIQELNQAIFNTNDSIDSLEQELALKFSSQKRSIDDWERARFVEIQNAETMSVADKFDEMVRVADRADAIRAQVEQNYANQKLELTKWQAELQATYAKAASDLTKGSLDSYTKELSIAKNIQDYLTSGVKIGATRIVKDAEGNLYLQRGMPISGGTLKMPVTQEGIESLYSEENLKGIDALSKLGDISQGLSSAGFSNEQINEKLQSIINSVMGP